VVRLYWTYRLCDIYVYDRVVVDGGGMVKQLWYEVVM
jgi:hypothetical protein